MHQVSKILVVSSLTEVATANYLVRALRDRGHTLLAYSDVRNELADVVGSGIVDVAKLSEAKGFEPDLVLFIEGGTMRVFPIGLEKLACRTAWYGIDTHMDYDKHLHISKLFDITFVAQKQYVSRLRADGIHQAFWLPLAFAPELYPEEELDRKYAVAYVGSVDRSMNPDRHRLLAEIQKAAAPVFIGRATPKEMGRIYAQAKIVFNKSVKNDINMRFFEAMGAGAVLMTNAIRDNGIADLFEPGTDFIEYTDEENLIQQIRALLDDKARREAIGRAARKKVCEHHTYGHRVDELLLVATKCAKTAAPGLDEYFGAFASSQSPVGILWTSNRALRSIDGGRRTRVLVKFLRLVLSTLESCARFALRIRT